MAVLDIRYTCRDCGRISPDDETSMVCRCGGRIRGEGVPGINGTRDSFGIKNIFKDDQTGREIDTWDKWEKAGYKQPKDVMKGDIKEKVKDNIKKRKNK